MSDNNEFVIAILKDYELNIQRENIIKYFASYCVLTEATNKLVNLPQIYLWSMCYEPLSEHVTKGTSINLKELFDKIKKWLLVCPKLENCFPPNIYDWKHIENFAGSIKNEMPLFISNNLLVKIMDLDKRYDDFVEKVFMVFDKYNEFESLNREQLIEIKKVFEDSYTLGHDLSLRALTCL